MDDDITAALIDLSKRAEIAAQQVKFAARGADLESLIEAREQLNRIGEAIDMHIEVQSQRWIDRFQIALDA